MKVGILTYHQADNYGAVLQAYALWQVIESKGIDCQIINYDCRAVGAQYRYRKLKFDGNLFANIKYNINCYLHRKKKENFAKFRAMMNLSPVYTKDTIKDAEDHYDCFIVGSDQVWNSNCSDGDFTYLLDFAKNRQKKNSYAASFGTADIPSDLICAYAALLKDFNNISVREERGAILVESLIGKRCPVVLDPVFLLDKEKWESFAGPKKEEYILVYQLYYTKSLLEFAESLSKKTGLKLVTISISLKTQVYSLFHSTNKSSVGPDEFVSLIANARYVVTNSFHGTALSVILKKQFFTELAPSEYNVNSRFDELFSTFELHDRIIKDTDYNIDNEIDYDKLDLILKQRKEESLEYLDLILSNL
ncbi:MAG: polysaccharide pyruvyl transferase family protein [Clostridia bacterium]|nr:polysaccharide pyruvyl transferase family protein [Clostridia bacterium]